MKKRLTHCHRGRWFLLIGGSIYRGKLIDYIAECENEGMKPHEIVGELKLEAYRNAEYPASDPVERAIIYRLEVLGYDAVD